MNQGIKRLVKAICRRFGFTIHPISTDRGLIDFLWDRKIDVVIDVGANAGQFGEMLRSSGYRGRIISLEPIESAFQILSRKASADGNWEAHHCGLGATAGEAVINVSELTVFSSLLTVTDAATQFDKRAAVARTEVIRLSTLDEVAARLTDRILLKIDTQGYEKQVLEGGRQTMSRLYGVWMELPIIHFYEGTWKFHEAIEFMEQFDFVPAQIHPVSYYATDPVSVSEVDCLFRPRDRSFATQGAIAESANSELPTKQ